MISFDELINAVDRLADDLNRLGASKSHIALAFGKKARSLAEDALAEIKTDCLDPEDVERLKQFLSGGAR